LGVGREEKGEGEMEERACWINLRGAMIWFVYGDQVGKKKHL
jgi:hypothetical protein